MRFHSTAIVAERSLRAFARLCLLAFVATLACAKPPTALVFRVLAENLVPAWCDQPAYRNAPECPAGAYRLDSVLVRVCRGPCPNVAANDCGDDEFFCRSFVEGASRTPQNVVPGDIVVTPAEVGGATRVGIVVLANARVPGTGGDPDTIERIRRRFVVTFVPESKQLVEVWLSSLCIGAVCPPESTCGRRSCEPVDNPPTGPYTPLPPPGSSDGGALDVSFDVAPRDVSDASDASDATDVTDASDVSDATDVTDAMDAIDASDGSDASDARDVSDGGAPETSAVDAALDSDATMVCGGVCSGGSMCCDGVCRDTLSNPSNCGGCGLACRAGEICRRGTCARFDSIGAGEMHTCAVNGGAVWCWGRNSDGRIGDASVTLRDRPTRVALPLGVASHVAVGSAHACAWMAGGAIACWGRNDRRQLGVSATGPALVPGVATVGSAAVGRDFSCASQGDGRVVCWGKNDLGQCGLAPGGDAAPTPLPDGAAIGFVERVVAGSAHACALAAGGAVWCWGANGLGQLGRGTTSVSEGPARVDGLTASALFAGADHTCAITTGRAVLCWGSNASRQVNPSSGVAVIATPATVSGVVPSMAATGAAGDAFSCVIAGDSRAVMCWGAGAVGQLGSASGTLDVAFGAGFVDGLTDVQSIAAGDRHACAKTTLGVVCWGSNRFGQLGVGTHGAPRATPAAIAPGALSSGVTAVAAGAAHACAIAGSNVWCWGRNTFGQLGNGTRGHASRPTQANLFGASTPLSICAGEAHTCAVMGDHTVRCWGDGRLGQLGNGMTASAEVPVALTGMTTAEKVTCGQSHTCALLAGGAVTCWGSNARGQVGLPLSPSPRLSPGLIAGVTATDIAAGATSTCATNSAGVVTCWGNDDVGQLGGGVAGAERATPVPVSLGAVVAGVLGGYGHHCAWGESLFCWGSNSSGQLGVGAVGATPAAPRGVPSIMTPSAVAGGFAHTCAVTGGLARSGTVLCWGDNRLGQVGVAPSAAPVTAPTAVMLAGGVEATAVAAGGGAGLAGADEPTGMTCAVTIAGAVQCWGSNVWGELGDGAAFAAQPVDVALPTM